MFHVIQYGIIDSSVVVKGLTVTNGVDSLSQYLSVCHFYSVFHSTAFPLSKIPRYREFIGRIPGDFLTNL